MKRLILILLLILLNNQICFGALADGTNCGFVTSAPSADPAGSNSAIAGNARVTKHTSASGTNSVSSMGWWCDTASTTNNFELGIYSHDATNNLANVLLSASQTNDKGDTAGWKTAALAYSLSASTIYWLGLQLDSGYSTNCNTGAITGGRRDTKAQSTLVNPWVTSSVSADSSVAVYAVYAADAGVTRRIIMVQ